MRQLSLLIKPASGSCNLCCSYCFYKDEMSKREQGLRGIMSRETIDKLLSNVFSSLTEETHIHFAFQGGEPLLAGKDFYNYFIEAVRKLNPIHTISYSIQTNGTLIDWDWAKLFADNGFLVGISVDGPFRLHDRYRCLPDGTGTHHAVCCDIELLREYDIPFNILTVITSRSANKAKAIYSFMKEQGYRDLQFIPCLPPIGDSCNEAVTPHKWFTFLDEMFELWYKDKKRGSAPSVNIFEDLVRLFSGLDTSQCGTNGKCHIQYVIEADGSVYPCDFYCSDEYCMGNICDNSLQELFCSSAAKSFLQPDKVTCSLCSSCPYMSLCNGQCRRQRVCIAESNYCALRSFIRKREPELTELCRDLFTKLSEQ